MRLNQHVVHIALITWTAWFSQNYSKPKTATVNTPEITKIRGWNQAQIHKESCIQAHTVYHTQGLFWSLKRPLQTANSAYYDWSNVEHKMSHASWLMFLTSKTLRSNGHRMRGTEQKKKENRQRPKPLHFIISSSSAVIFHNKRVKWRISNNVWFNTFPQTQTHGSDELLSLSQSQLLFWCSILTSTLAHLEGIL